MRISDWSSDVCSSDLPLPPKSAKGFRHQNPAQRPRFVENCPMVALQLPADVDVLGDHIEAPIAHVIKCTTTEGCDNTGHRENSAIDALCALYEAYDRGEHADLELPEQARSDESGGRKEGVCKCGVGGVRDNEK